uniref:Glypican-6 n=1 Tax=Strigamia maritima TaxID=126957 RepID=T1J8P2_STRMM
MALVYPNPGITRPRPWLRTIGLILCFISFITENIDSAEVGCNTVRYAYSAKGFNGVQVPRQPVPGTHLRICQQGETCCTEEMEENFNQQSRQEFDRILKQTIDVLRHTFSTRTQKFDDYFQDLLRVSKKAFHEMFVRTYGTLYEQNAHVFTDLYDNLEKYYLRGNVNLADALDSFFITLYQRMFQVLNAQYTFDQKFLNCMQEFMDDLKPFGDVPQKLSVQIRRAFVAAKTFTQSLGVGRDIVKSMMDVPATGECTRALMKMTYCPHCQGLPDLKPCNTYCMNVMKGCLGYHTELDAEWNTYIEALVALADRLEGPFNIESVVEPMDIKISEAIMNFQESGQQVSQKIFENCGKPSIGKRDVERELNYDTLKFGRHDGGASRNTAGGTNLNRVVRDIRNKVKVARNYWSNLPYQMCDKEHMAADPVAEDNCWNGLAKTKFEPYKTGDGVDSHSSEVDVEANKPNSLVNQQVLSLRMTTSKLKSAYSGMDVDWPDNDWNGSGSGSGDGSNVDGGSGNGAEPPEDPYFAPTTTTVKPAKTTTTITSKAPTQQRMTLQKALNIFVFPIMVMWLGSVF